MHPRLTALASLLGALILAQPVWAEPTAEQCVAVYNDGLEKKNSGQLIDARSRFAECTDPACPGPVREECDKLVRNLDTRIPSVVLAAHRKDGAELTDVRVTVNGRTLVESLDGRAHKLDPGAYTFVFEADGLPSVEVQKVLAEGERLKRIEAEFVDPDADAGAATGSDAPIPTLTYVLGGVGVAGLIGFTAFGLSGLSQESDLKRCEPDCPQDETDKLKRTYLFADISLAVGIVGLGGATYFYVSSRYDAPGRAPLDGRVFGVGGHF
jgi:hypothetical protein